MERVGLMARSNAGMVRRRFRTTIFEELWEEGLIGILKPAVQKQQRRGDYSPFSWEFLCVSVGFAAVLSVIAFLITK